MVRSGSFYGVYSGSHSHSKGPFYRLAPANRLKIGEEMILRCCNDVPTARWWVTLLLCIGFLAPRCTSEHRIESFLLGSGDSGDASFSGHLRHGRRLADGSTSSSSTPIKSTKRIEGAMIIDEKKYREGGLKSRHKLSHAKEFSAALFGNASGN